MLRYIFMHFSNKLSEKISKSPVLGIHALIAAIGLHTVSCISTQDNSTPPAKNQYPGTIQVSDPNELARLFWDPALLNQKNNISEEDLKLSILIQAGIKAQKEIEEKPEFRSLHSIKGYIQEQVGGEKKVKITSYKPKKINKNKYTYITVSVDGLWTTDVYSENLDIAEELYNQISMNDAIYYPQGIN